MTNLYKTFDDSFKKDVIDLIKQGLKKELPAGAVYSASKKPPEGAKEFTTDRGTKYWVPSKTKEEDSKSTPKADSIPSVNDWTGVEGKNINQVKSARKKLNTLKKKIQKDIKNNTGFKPEYEGYQSIQKTSGVHHHTPIADPEYTLTFQDGSTMQMSQYMMKTVEAIAIDKKNLFGYSKDFNRKARNPDSYKTKEAFINMMDDKLEQPRSVTEKSGWNYMSEKEKDAIKSQRDETPMTINEITDSFIIEEDLLSDKQKKERGKKFISNIKEITNTGKPIADMDIDTETAQNVLEQYNKINDYKVEMGDRILMLPLDQMIAAAKSIKETNSWKPRDADLGRKKAFSDRPEIEDYHS